MGISSSGSPSDGGEPEHRSGENMNTMQESFDKKWDVGNGLCIMRDPNNHNNEVFDLFCLLKGEELLEDGKEPFTVCDEARKYGADPNILYEVAKQLCYKEDAAVFKPRKNVNV